MENLKEQLKTFLDADGRLTKFPAKRRMRQLALSYLAEKFESGRDYTEKEINEILTRWHTFGDFFLLRRELYMNRFLGRERDGNRYWLEQPQPDLSEYM